MIDFDADILRREAQACEDADASCDDFSVGLGRVVADQIDVPLQKLAQAAALGAFGAEHGGRTKPFGGLGEGVGFSRVETRECGRELGAQGVGFFAAIASEAEKFADDAIATFDGVELEVFEGWAVDFFEAVDDGCAAPGFEHEAAFGGVEGVEIAGAGWGLIRLLGHKLRGYALEIGVISSASLPEHYGDVIDVGSGWAGGDEGVQIRERGVRVVVGECGLKLRACGGGGVREHGRRDYCASGGGGAVDAVAAVGEECEVGVRRHAEKCGEGEFLAWAADAGGVGCVDGPFAAEDEGVDAGQRCLCVHEADELLSDVGGFAFDGVLGSVDVNTLRSEESCSSVEHESVAAYDDLVRGSVEIFARFGGFWLEGLDAAFEVSGDGWCDLREVARLKDVQSLGVGGGIRDGWAAGDGVEGG